MHNISLPELSANAKQSSQNLCEAIMAEMKQHDGAISFAHFMQMALYEPRWGYYTGGAHKIGAAGDFITAPTLTPLFGQTLAQQLRVLLPQTAGYIYEFGAGTGALAVDLLNALSGSLKKYHIIELSSELTERQRAYLQKHAPKYVESVIWLNKLPETFDGIVLGNEVLDAMPVERIRRDEHGNLTRAYVVVENEQFCFQYRLLDDEKLIQAACQYLPNVPDYTSELHLVQRAFITTVAEKLTRGVMIWIDYGFDAAQYYHWQRSEGTLMGHHRHHAVHDPFFRVGLTDLTAHVNFTDIAEAGVCAGLDLIGYTTQANFLFNLGILDILVQQHPQCDTPEYVKAAHALQQLTAPHEMGELFKVMALGRNIDVDWRGFAQGDLCYKL